MIVETSPSLYALSTQGLRCITESLHEHLLLAFDFDGTLAPIVTSPEHARPSQSVIRAMQRLCELAPVAVVSGRILADVRERLGFTPRYVIGNHGIEDETGEADSESLTTLTRWRAVLDDQAAHLAEAGVRIEDKQLSFSLHYRIARDRDRALAAIDELVTKLTPAPKLIGGKFVLNILPPDAPDKFQALDALRRAQGFRSAFFMGDDITDDIVFEKAPRDWITIRVEPKEGTGARFHLTSQTEVVSLIQALINHLDEQRRQ